MAVAPKGKRFVAPKGNRFWEARSSHGRKPIFETPDALADACQQYFQWVEDNPLWEEKHFHHQGSVTKTKLPKMRAMTLDGLCLFLDIDDQTWRNYAAKRDFIGVTSRVMAAIRTQKFSGAAADLLNANIIARDLGLSDKSELSGKDGGAIQIEDKNGRDPMELARVFVFALNKAQHEAAEAKKEQGGAGALPST